MSNRALFAAIIDNDSDLLVSLLESGLDIEQRCGTSLFSATPLQMASRNNGQLEIMGILLDKGANTEVVDRLGNTILLTAVHENRIDTVKMLLSHDADTTATTASDRKTAIHIAVDATCVNHDLIGILIVAGVDVSAADKFGCTALHYAAKYGDRSLARNLMQHNVNTLAINVDGFTAAEVATRARHCQFATSIDAINANRAVAYKNRCHAFAQGLYDPKARGRTFVNTLSEELVLKILHSNRS